MKKTILLLSICIMMLGVCGCVKNHTSENQTTTENILNTRQRLILSSMGLPSDYSKLDAFQRKKIMSIDEMLCYAEEKYNTKFLYCEYCEEDSCDYEYMLARPVGAFTYSKEFKITRTSKGLEDNYLDVLAYPLFSEMFYDDIKKISPETEALMIAPKGITTSLEDIPSEKQELEGKVSFKIYLFVYKKDFNNEEEREKFTEKLIKSVNRHNWRGRIDIFYVKKHKYLEENSEYAYHDMLGEKYNYDHVRLVSTNWEDNEIEFVP